MIHFSIQIMFIIDIILTLRDSLIKKQFAETGSA